MSSDRGLKTHISSLKATGPEFGTWSSSIVCDGAACTASNNSNSKFLRPFITTAQMASEMDGNWVDHVWVEMK